MYNVLSYDDELLNVIALSQNFDDMGKNNVSRRNSWNYFDFESFLSEKRVIGKVFSVCRNGYEVEEN